MLRNVFRRSAPVDQFSRLIVKSLNFSTSAASDPDVLIVGSGHNGLVAACLLARQGLKVCSLILFPFNHFTDITTQIFFHQVEVLEEKPVIGGACKTEYPYSKVPGLGQSTGAYLCGLIPPELLNILGLKLPLLKRSPHYFLPRNSNDQNKNSYLFLTPDDEDSNRRQIEAFSSPEDYLAHKALNDELEALRTDLAPAFMQPPLTIEQAAEKYVRPSLQQAFINLARGSVKDYIEKYGFKSTLLKMMYASTDGITGLQGRYDSPGGGMNFFVHNMCRLPGSNGTWMLVEGGMGAITQRLSVLAQQAGAVIKTSTPIKSIDVNSSNSSVVVTGVTLTNGRQRKAKVLLVNADPFRLRELVGRERISEPLNKKLDGLFKEGMSMKVNLALKKYPQYTCLSSSSSVNQNTNNNVLSNEAAHRTTTHLLPDEDVVEHMVYKAYDDAAAGQLPEFPTIQVYSQTAVDPSLRDAAGHQSAALFVHPVPYNIQGSSWEAEETSYVNHLLSIWERFAPGVSDLVEDSFVLTPPKIEAHFGITRGVIHHIDNSFGFADRWPYSNNVQGLYSCSAGTHPGGSVIGCAGHNSAREIIKDLGLEPWWRVPKF